MEEHNIVQFSIIMIFVSWLHYCLMSEIRSNNEIRNTAELRIVRTLMAILRETEEFNEALRTATNSTPPAYSETDTD